MSKSISGVLTPFSSKKISGVLKQSATVISGTISSGSAASSGQAEFSDITVSNLQSTIESTSITLNADASEFEVVSTEEITGNSIITATKPGSVKSSFSKANEISGETTVTTILPKIKLSEIVGQTDLEVTPIVVKSSATQAAASGAITTVKPTTQHYIAVNVPSITAITTITPKVTSEGYGTTSVYDATSATIKAGSAESDIYYVPIAEASHLMSKAADNIISPITSVKTSVNQGDVTPVIYTEKVGDYQYVKIDANASTTKGTFSTNVICTSTEGYTTAIEKELSVSADIPVEDAKASSVYFRVYDGKTEES